MSTKPSAANVVSLDSKKLSPSQAAKRLTEAGYDSTTHETRVRKSFAGLVKAGLRPVPLHAGSKAPVGEEWQKQPHPSAEDFKGYANIGIFTGEAGGNIVDIDKDDTTVTAEELEHFFPPTPYKFGRYYGGDNLQISHWLYRVTDPGKLHTGARSPIADSKGKYPAIEVRCNNTQTMAPGSTIVDEKRGYIVDSVRWAGGELDPPDSLLPTVTRAQLIQCANVLIVSKYCAEYFKSGHFHFEMLWWCGFLISAGVDDELVERSVEYIVKVTGQQDDKDRKKSIETTRRQVEMGEKVAGIGHLKQSPNWSVKILQWAAKVINADKRDLEDDRPSVRIISSKEPQWLDLALSAMYTTGKFYQQNGQAVIVNRADNKAQIIPLDKTVNAASWLTREIRFTQGALDKSTGVMTDEDIKCPNSLAQEIADPSTFKGGLKQLRGISSTPVITVKGRIVDDTWNYDDELRLFFSSEFPFQRMYPDEALPILNETLSDFPFLSERYRVAALGAILTAVVRPVLDICPLFVITSSQYSDGKSVLSGVIAGSVGVEASLGQLTRSGSDEEQEKQLSAILSRGRRVVTLDNHDGEFRSPALTEALTSTNPEFRVLGKNETRSVPNNTMFLLNGVNTVPALDLQTRSVFIRLARTSLDPHRVFKHPDIVGFTFDNRAKIVSAALSLIKHALESEVTDWKPTHRFKIWDTMVRRTMMHLTGVDIAPPAREDSERPTDPIEEVRQEFLEWVLRLWESGVRDNKRKNWIRGKVLAEHVPTNSEVEDMIKTLSHRQNHSLEAQIGRCLSMVKEVPFETEKGVFRVTHSQIDGFSAYKVEQL